jgi:predicted adenylyl cyclase CyaB
MREVELKSVVDDVARRRRTVERAGGTLMFEGRLIDYRYGDSDGRLLAQDNVLRLRVYEGGGKREGFLEWKGPTLYESGYKVRQELSSPVGDPDALGEIIASIGFIVILEIERQIAQYRLHGATVRFEEYPRMDSLVEVEGAPDEIEQAIASIGLPRERFTSERLPAFITRFEDRTGSRAALSARELGGDYRYSLGSA